MSDHELPLGRSAETPAPLSDSPVGRRRFLTWVSGVGAAVTAALVGLPVLRAFFSPAVSTAPGSGPTSPTGRRGLGSFTGRAPASGLEGVVCIGQHAVDLRDDQLLHRRMRDDVRDCIGLNPAPFGSAKDQENWASCCAVPHA